MQESESTSRYYIKSAQHLNIFSGPIQLNRVKEKRIQRNQLKEPLLRPLICVRASITWTRQAVAGAV